MSGDPMLFARQDEVENQWRIVDPVIASPPPISLYEPGTWGPSEAERLAPSSGGWRVPGERACR
jgi:glucose-6-phosphate 1-dehydrogenase